MSFITFDFLCTNCDRFYESLMVRRSELEETSCKDCGALLKRLPAGPVTTFKFGDRSAVKSRKAVSLRDPQGGASSKGHSKSLD